MAPKMCFTRNNQTDLLTEIDTISHEKRNGQRQKQRRRREKADLGRGENGSGGRDNFVE
uniref:Uncharacterized protein n=1 Tax=Cucumis melo TaxID=3656 RepID=A0A9I9CJ98_CUCME